MSERRIEYMRVDQLVPALRNPRQHDIDRLRQSVERFGYTVPGVMDERTGRLVAGHGRTQLLLLDEQTGRERPPGIGQDDGGAWTAPVVRGWASEDDAEAEAYLIADNRLTEIGGWHTVKLVSSLQRIQAGPGLTGIGYDAQDVDDLLAKLQESRPEGLPPAEPPPNERHTGVRSFVLDYPLEEYEYVAKVAHRARHHYQAASNAELFEVMLREQVGKRGAPA